MEEGGRVAKHDPSHKYKIFLQTGKPKTFDKKEIEIFLQPQACLRK